MHTAPPVPNPASPLPACRGRALTLDVAAELARDLPGPASVLVHLAESDPQAPDAGWRFVLGGLTDATLERLSPTMRERLESFLSRPMLECDEPPCCLAGAVITSRDVAPLREVVS